MDEMKVSLKLFIIALSLACTMFGFGIGQLLTVNNLQVAVARNDTAIKGLTHSQNMQMQTQADIANMTQSIINQNSIFLSLLEINKRND